jgi:hypothetical protein
MLQNFLINFCFLVNEKILSKLKMCSSVFISNFKIVKKGSQFVFASSRNYKSQLFGGFYKFSSQSGSALRGKMERNKRKINPARVGTKALIWALRSGSAHQTAAAAASIGICAGLRRARLFLS